MFFIFGFGHGKKLFSNSDTVICGQCGGFGRYQLFMTYSYFSLFFLRILQWDRNYYLQMECCNALYQLNPEVGKQLARGERMEIGEADRTLIHGGNGGFRGRRKRCDNCGFEMDGNYAYCPNCGCKL